MITKTPLLALVSVFIASSLVHEASTVGCYFPRDVVFLLDTSGSVGSTAFQKNLDFVKMIVQAVVSTGPGGMQIGVGSFSKVGRVEFHMNAFTQVSDVVAAVAAIPYPGGTTNIGAGIKTMTAMFQAQFGARPNTLRYGIVMTDGGSNLGATKAAADAARAANIIMIGVGIGIGRSGKFNSNRRKVVNRIGNSPAADYVFFPKSYADLTLIEDLLRGITNCYKRPYGIVEIAVGHICSGTPPCYSNAHCVLDGTNAGITRCLCEYGYIYVENLICARIITTTTDPNCATCESNGGLCYDASNDNTKDGCHCPSFRSGVDCQKSHATVSCDVSTFTMTICYEEQAQYVAAGAVVLVDGSGMKVACKAVKVTKSGSACPVGHHQLVLPLDSSKLGTCGTKSVMSDITTRKYLNTILVQHRLQEMHMDDVSFTASCSYDTHANTIFEPVGIAVATEEKGKHYKSTLTFYVENQLGNKIAEAVELRLGDKIRFGIDLTDDGTYSAIRVVRCLASSRPSLVDPTAVTLPLILNSCPSADQSHVSDTNNWQQVSGAANHLRTGFILMFKMSQGRSVHIHCMVKLCLKGSEADCGAVSCSNPSSHNSYGRRKRSAEAGSFFEISRKLTWYTPQSSSSTEEIIAEVESPSNFAVIVGVLGVGLAIFIVIVVFLIRKRSHSQKKTPATVSVARTPATVSVARTPATVSVASSG